MSDARTIRPIQYLRAIAALMVVWYHSPGQVAGLSMFIPSFGATGVALFFVISGFIMLVTTSGTGVSAGKFIMRRVIRVVPLYWLVTILMIACAAIAPSAFRTLRVLPAALAESLLFIPFYSLSFP